LLLNLLTQLLPQRDRHLQRQFAQPHRNDVRFLYRDLDGELLHLRQPKEGEVTLQRDSFEAQSAVALLLPLRPCQPRWPRSN